MNKLAILVFLFLLAACNNSNPSSSRSPVSQPIGLIRVDISSSGEASAQWLGGIRGQEVSVKPINGTSGINDIHFQKNAVGSYDDLIKGHRYVVTSFNITNRTDSAFHNFTLYAVNIPGTTQGGTGIVSIRDIAGNPITDESVYRNFQPSHGMGPGVSGLQVSAPIADLQWFTPSEAASAQTQATSQGIIPDTATVLEYGFVARGLNVAVNSLKPSVVALGSRYIGARDTPADCTSNICKGSITLTYRFPIQTPASANPFRFTLYFIAADESDGHVSQSIEEQSANTVAGLNNTTGFLQTRILSGSSFGASQSSLTNLCQVKTAIPTVLNPNIALSPSSIPTAAGSLDTCFGAVGKKTTDLGSRDDFAYALALQSDSKIVVAGRTFNGSNYDFALARYSPNGSLDTAFGSNGRVITDFGSSDDNAYTLAIQSDDKIVLAGYSYNGSSYDFALARYNPNGSLDTTFDGDGKIITPIGSGADFAYALAIQSDGKIVLAGYSYNGSNYDFALARYGPNGSLDTSFGNNGRVITDFGSSNDFAYTLAIQSDRKIVLAGYSNVSGNNDFALTRYNSNGSLDTTFDTDGKLTTAVGTGSDQATALALQGDGKIVLAGYSYSYNGSNYDFALARYNPNGSLDTAFDIDGKVTTDFGASADFAYALAIQSDGKIVVTGYSFIVSNNDFALTRYNLDGSLDTSFGGDGTITTPVGFSDDRTTAITIQSDGKIVVAGYSSSNSNDFALARYNP